MILVFKDGVLKFYKGGVLHNSYGPAVIRGDKVEFWENGNFIEQDIIR